MNYEKCLGWAAGLRSLQGVVDGPADWASTPVKEGDLRFDLRLWVAVGGPMVHRFARRKTTEGRFQVMRECGFAGCAVGWLPVVMPEDFTYRTAYEYMSEECGLRVGRRGRVPKRQREERHVSLIMDVFDLTEDQACAIVDPVFYNGTATPLMVAERIERMVRAVKAGFWNYADQWHWPAERVPSDVDFSAANAAACGVVETETQLNEVVS